MKDDSNLSGAGISRRHLLKGGMVTAAVAVSGLAWETETITVTHHRLTMKGLRGSSRLVQLSDLHRSWCVSESFLSRVVERAISLHPDTIALTGDFVTGHSSYMETCARQLKRLTAPQGIFAVLGNHDYRCDNWKGAPAISEGLHAIGVEMLTNNSQKLDCGARIIGIDDYDTGKPDADAAFGKITDSEPMVAITHNPLLFSILKGYRCVTLAGHTHGGQIDIPFLTPLLMDSRSRYLRGWFQAKGWPGKMYVSRGLGVLGIPVRFNAAPEISVFDLEPY